MAALDNIYSGFDINKQINDSYTGPLFSVWSKDSGSDTPVPIEQNANGEPDLVKFANENDTTIDWAYDTGHDQWSVTDWYLIFDYDKGNFAWDNNRWSKFWDGTTQEATTNADGKLIIPKAVGNTQAKSINDIPLGNYSAFVRHKMIDYTDSDVWGLLSTIDTVSGYTPRAEEASADTDFHGSNFGTPDFYIDGVDQSFADRGAVWTAFKNTLSVAGVVNFDLNEGRTVAEPLCIFSGQVTNNWSTELEHYTSVLVYTGDVGTSVDDTQPGEIQTLLDDIYSPSTLTGTAKILGTVKSGVTAVFFESDDVELTNFNKLGTDTSDANGEVEYTGTYDDTKHIGVMFYILEFDEADNPTVWAMIEWIYGLDITPPA